MHENFDWSQPNDPLKWLPEIIIPMYNFKWYPMIKGDIWITTAVWCMN